MENDINKAPIAYFSVKIKNKDKIIDLNPDILDHALLNRSLIFCGVDYIAKGTHHLNYGIYGAFGYVLQRQMPLEQNQFSAHYSRILLQLSPSILYHINPNWSIGLQARMIANSGFDRFFQSYWSSKVKLESQMTLPAPFTAGLTFQYLFQ